MSNPMDKVPFVNVPQNDTMMNVIQQARMDPFGFEQRIRQTNPKGYERACQIRNSANPREAILQMAKERGLDPNILRMFGIM